MFPTKTANSNRTSTNPTLTSSTTSTTNHHPHPMQHATQTQSQHQALTQTQTQKQEDPEDSFLNLLSKYQHRTPPHFSFHSSSSSMIHQEGIVPFKYTLAATVETTTAEKEIHKRNRARIFAKLFSSTRLAQVPSLLRTHTSFQPPGIRGSMVVVTLPLPSISCPILPSILFFLATYYNLFVLLDLSLVEKHKNIPVMMTQGDRYKRHEEQMKQYITLLRSSSSDTTEENSNSNSNHSPFLLTEQVLPSHRILGMKTWAGRIAFVRQLPKKPLFVLEYQEHVRDTLQKFGFVVLMYNPDRTLIPGKEEKEEGNTNKTKSSCISGLAYELYMELPFGTKES